MPRAIGAQRAVPAFRLMLLISRDPVPPCFPCEGMREAPDCQPDRPLETESGSMVGVAWSVMDRDERIPGEIPHRVTVAIHDHEVEVVGNTSNGQGLRRPIIVGDLLAGRHRWVAGVGLGKRS